MKENYRFFRLLQACFVDVKNLRLELCVIYADTVVLVGPRVLDVLCPSLYHSWFEIWETLDVFSRSARY